MLINHISQYIKQNPTKEKQIAADLCALLQGSRDSFQKLHPGAHMGKEQGCELPTLILLVLPNAVVESYRAGAEVVQIGQARYSRVNVSDAANKYPNELVEPMVEMVQRIENKDVQRLQLAAFHQ
jgi:hypothetical protein